MEHHYNKLIRHQGTLTVRQLIEYLSCLIAHNGENFGNFKIFTLRNYQVFGIKNIVDFKFDLHKDEICLLIQFDISQRESRELENRNSRFLEFIKTYIEKEKEEKCQEYFIEYLDKNIGKDNRTLTKIIEDYIPIDKKKIKNET